MRFLPTIKSRADISGTATVPNPASTATELASGRLLLRPATHEDLPATARAHVLLLPFGLFPSLGARFVRRWQRTFLDSRHGVGFVVVDATAAPEELVGFVLGTSDQAAYTTGLMADRRTVASLAVTGFAALCLRPRVAVRLLRSRVRPWTRRLLHHRAAPAPARSTPDAQVAVMTALAVRPDWRKGGIGERLVEHFVEYVRGAGATWVELQTSTGPLGAVGFYERLGWEAGSQRSTPDGDVIRTYRRVLR
ncbi:N-acetyltransferase [Plantactinospora sp. BB1]|uniref:GNAT family N-acetyltransferase n=1 Tax=Plantactinospora sp. BB1 TaxID=2071627 RepID=UPI000D16B54D|nr:GNAT family N-acetyltransferase [Plantactinospora sp. BB1]AVT35255.1 GNAT family N-acetyltransferase [Plantactinospora sp. BB1]